MVNHLAVLLCFVALGGSIQSLQACFCIIPPDSAERADVIFMGRVIEVQYPDEKFSQYNLDGTATFIADSVVKGAYGLNKGEKLSIVQNMNTCSFSFWADSAYLVYADYAVDKGNLATMPYLTIRACSGTRLLLPSEKRLFPAPVDKPAEASQKEPFDYLLPLLLVSILVNIVLLMAWWKKNHNSLG